VLHRPLPVEGGGNKNREELRDSAEGSAGVGVRKGQAPTRGPGLGSRKTECDDYLTFTLAAFNPFGPGATSTSTSWPSYRVFRPGTLVWIAE
jgi:hypothetical protein